MKHLKYQTRAAQAVEAKRKLPRTLAVGLPAVFLLAVGYDVLTRNGWFRELAGGRETGWVMVGIGAALLVYMVVNTIRLIRRHAPVLFDTQPPD